MMSTASVQSIARQTRQIYDALDNNNAKQALTLSQKYYKKHPNVPIYKALYAYALSLTKKLEEASQLVDELLKMEVHDDIHTLSTMALTMRKLGKKNEIVSLYEKAYAAHPEDEELGIELFNAAIKAMDFKKANWTSMKMYKRFNSVQYYYWSVMSLYNEAQLAPPSEPLKAVALPDMSTPLPMMGASVTKPSVALVEKMIKKALTDKKLKTYQEYSLCLLVSEKDPEMMMQLLSIPQSIFPTEIDAIKWKLNIWHHLKAWQEIYDFVRQLKPVTMVLDDWEIMTLYLDAASHLLTACADTEMKQAQLERLSFWPNATDESGYHSRARLLAQIEIASRFYDALQVSESIEQYFVAFGGKDSCFADVLPYLPKAHCQAYFQTFIRTAMAEKPNDVARLVCALKIDKFYAQKESAQPAPMPVDYLALYQMIKEQGGMANADLIILAVSTLVKSDENEEGAMLSSENLYKAALILLSGLQDIDNNFHLKLLLIFVLRELGGGSLAMSLYRSLNIKFMQLDMLSYIVFDWIPLIGHLDVVESLCSEISTIYRSNESETPDMLIEGYKYGSYAQIPDFIDFYAQIKYSIQKKIVEITQIQVETIRIESKAELASFFLNLNLPRLDRTVIDNRPVEELFSVWSSYNELSTFIKKNGTKDTSWIETCYAILISMKLAFSPATTTATGLLLSESEHIENLLRDLVLEGDKIDPLLAALLSLVQTVYCQEHHNLPGAFERLASVLGDQLGSLSELDLTHLVPDTILVKVESLVEVIHYATIFLTGLSRSEKLNASTVKPLSDQLSSLCSSLAKGLETVSPIWCPPTFDHASFSVSPKLLIELESSLTSDWKAIHQHARKILESCRSILKSL